MKKVWWEYILSEARLTKILGLENVCKQQNANHVQKKINCHDKISWHFPDIGQMAKIPWHFFKIPWQFPDLEKILFFPDFSLTRGNPVLGNKINVPKLERRPQVMNPSMPRIEIQMFSLS